MPGLYSITSFLIFATLLESTHTRALTPGDDVTPPLANPCVTAGRRETGTGSTSMQLHDALTELKTRCSEGMDTARILSNLLGKRIQSPLLMDILRNRHEPEFLYPGNLSSWERGQQMEPILERDNRNLQKTEVFLKRMLNDEKKTYNGELTQNIKNVLNKVYAILCMIQSIGTSESFQYARNTTVPVLGSGVTLLSDASRTMHDYVILRDLGDVLDIRRHTYENMTLYQ